MNSSCQDLPGVGPALARELADLGYLCPDDLIGADPERMYQRLIELRKKPIDRCVLYVFRCAVYAAAHPRAGGAKSKWWHWKDRA